MKVVPAAVNHENEICPWFSVSVVADDWVKATVQESLDCFVAAFAFVGRRLLLKMVVAVVDYCRNDDSEACVLDRLRIAERLWSVLHGK